MNNFREMRLYYIGAPVVKANDIGLTFELMFVQTLWTMPNTVVKKFKVKGS